MSATTDTRVVIVGAGPAGLATAACLKRRGIEHVVLERRDAVGSSWRRHYERLHLHTHKRNSALPFGRWPATAPAYPSRDEVVAYLDAYSRAHALQPRLGATVHDARRHDGAWLVTSTAGRYRARHLVLATGVNDVPVRPTWPGRDTFPGRVLHSSEFRNGEPFRGARMCVVGFGNSGGEIALDLVEHGAAVTLAVRSPVGVTPRRVLGVPVEDVGRWLGRLPAPVAEGVVRTVQRLRYGDLPRHGLRLAEAPRRAIGARGRIPLIDIGTVDLIRRGVVQVRPGIARFDGPRLHLVDGNAADVDAVVLATGYRPGYPSFLANAPEARPGDPPPEAPGLHTVGLRVTAGGTLRLIAEEALAVAGRIAARDAAAR